MASLECFAKRFSLMGGILILLDVVIILSEAFKILSLHYCIDMLALIGLLSV